MSRRHVRAQRIAAMHAISGIASGRFLVPHGSEVNIPRRQNLHHLAHSTVNIILRNFADYFFKFPTLVSVPKTKTRKEVALKGHEFTRADKPIRLSSALFAAEKLAPNQVL
jgi:hypothetical protein